MDEMSYEHILYDVTDGVAAITFNLPQFANAMDFQGVRETFDALMRAEDDDVVGAVLITGAGKAFSAGGNVKHMRDKTDMFAGAAADIERAYADGIHRVQHRRVRTICKQERASLARRAASRTTARWPCGT